jgi:hypothetical protein
MEPREVYRRAAEVLRTRGWGTEEYESEDGRVCLVGAIYLAAFGESAEDADNPTQELEAEGLYEPLRDHVATLDGGNWGIHGDDGPIYWNDAEGRTAGEVVGLLEALAAP